MNRETLVEITKNPFKYIFFIGVLVTSHFLAKAIDMNTFLFYIFVFLGDDLLSRRLYGTEDHFYSLCETLVSLLGNLILFGLTYFNIIPVSIGLYLFFGIGLFYYTIKTLVIGFV